MYFRKSYICSNKLDSVSHSSTESEIISETKKEVITEQGSSASQMTAAKVMDIISRLPGCAGQATDAVSAETQVKMEDDPSF